MLSYINILFNFTLADMWSGRILEFVKSWTNMYMRSTWYNARRAPYRTQIAL